ncbi:glycosyltransferase family 2 protein [Methylobacterium hispanicum]|uniref:glycosyltransferase family 2 protein n=1 Tax=Methylobacterium hispanicum TaxID=270350 RepID=UPI002F35C9E2
MDYLTACCTAKNEGSYIAEWIAFHLTTGFDRLVIIDNGSIDGTGKVARAFGFTGQVDVIDWPGPGTQVEMYEKVARDYRDRTEWLAFIDADEFLYPVEGADLRKTLAEMGDIDGVGVHWHIYGSNGHTQAVPGLTVETYTRRAEDSFLLNRHIKTMARAARIEKIYSSHLIGTAGGIVDDGGAPIPMTEPYGFYADKPACWRKFRINHYHTRSRGEYQLKASRGYFGIDDEKLSSEQRIADMFACHDRNEVLDESAIRFVPGMHPLLRQAEGWSSS